LPQPGNLPGCGSLGDGVAYYATRGEGKHDTEKDTWRPHTKLARI
jgi:hypothetical protein